MSMAKLDTELARVANKRIRTVGGLAGMSSQSKLDLQTAWFGAPVSPTHLGWETTGSRSQGVTTPSKNNTLEPLEPAPHNLRKLNRKM